MLFCLSLIPAFGISSSVKTVKSPVRKTVLINDGPDYKDLNITGNYESNPIYDPEGFDWLYTITKDFMDLILEEAIPKDVITITRDNNIQFDLTNNVSEVLGQYAYIVAVCLIIVIFALAMLVAGFCFTCYCCCCSCCSSTNSSKTEKSETCKFITLITLLIICGALITFGAVCAFQANLRFRNGIQEFPGDMQKSVNDTRTYLDMTGQQIDILLSYNFKQFLEWVLKELDECTSSVQTEIDQISTNVTETNIFKIASDFDGITRDVEELQNFTTDIANLVNSFSQIKDRLNGDINECQKISEVNCEDLKKSTDELNFDIDITDANNKIHDVNNILSYSNNIKGGQQKFNKIKKEIENKIEDGKNQAKSKINETAATMRGNADQISTEIEKLKSYFSKTDEGTGDIESLVEDAQDFVDNNSSYLYYVGLFICCLIFVIVCLLAVGMILGFFKISILNKLGSVFLLSGTTFMFYLTLILAAVTLVYFLIGLIAQQAVCKSLRDPSNSEFFHLIDEFNLSKSGLNITISQILLSIHKNESIYNVFNLRNKFDLGELNDTLKEFKTELDNLESVVDQIDFNQFEMLTPTQVESLRNIPDPQISKVATLIDTLETTINQVNVDNLKAVLAQKIDDIGNMTIKTAELTELLSKLKNSSADLNQIGTHMNDLKNSISNERTVLGSLEKKLNFGASSFTDGRNNLINSILYVQNIAGVESPKLFKKIVTDFADKTFNVCEEYINIVANNIMNDVGQCGPLGVIYDATLTSTCDKVALQMNSFWFVLLWTMLLFLPTVIISAKLASCYKSEGSPKTNKIERNPKRPKIKKAITTEDDDVIPFGWNRNANLVSRNVDDITLEAFNYDGHYPKLDSNEIDEIRRWKQYPEVPMRSTRF